MKARSRMLVGSIAFAALAAAGGCATDDGYASPPPSDRAVQDFAEDECPECVPPGTAPVQVEEAE
jgi:hypothetical protein